MKQNTQSKRGEVLHLLENVAKYPQGLTELNEHAVYHTQIKKLLREGEVFMVEGSVYDPSKIGTAKPFSAPPYPTTIIEVHHALHDTYFFLLSKELAGPVEGRKSDAERFMVFELSLHTPGSAKLADGQPTSLGLVDYVYGIVDADGFAHVSGPISVEHGGVFMGNSAAAVASITNNGPMIIRALELISQFEYDTVPAPKRLNKKRAKKGKPPFYEYHTLTLRPRKPEPGPDLGGTHASPRRHKRRGHYRHLASGAVVWVRNCVVGSGSEGVVEKDYQITA